MYCAYCGNKLDENQKFCSSCGKSIESEIAVDNKSEEKREKPLIRCGNCGYEGPGEPARSMWAKVLAWIVVPFAPLITILYFAISHKYRCPKCKSSFLGIKNKNGIFENPRTGHKPLLILVYVLVGIALMGIISSIILASLNTAREKAQQAQEGSSTLNSNY